MFSFFVPVGKVQKDRRIMRETDLRMARYSRRGLIFNFAAYLICLMGGRFVNENRDLTITLTIGLLAVTILRGVLLFRFKHLYPRAPQRWRRNYFIATLLGSIWWAVILVSITLKLEMQDEAPLLWLYTIVFFSTTAHAFAPYQKFLTYYQFVGLIPAAISAFTLGVFDAYLYGALVIAFYIVLIHQCRLISENYWERLEATYALSRKAQSLEEEKRDSKASVQLNKEFMANLNRDLYLLNTDTQDLFRGQADVTEQRAKQRAVQKRLDRIYTNVSDFNSIISKELLLNTAVFNIRHELQHIIAAYVDEAEQQGVQIEASLSPTLPMRLRGDASRFAQVIRTMLYLCLKNFEKGLVLVEVEFLREYENAGELYVTASRVSGAQKKLFSTSDQKMPSPIASLSLAVAKGIADLMQGSIEVNEIPMEGQQIRFNAKIDVAEHIGQMDFHRNSFAGHSVMLVNENPKIVDLKRVELEALGFDVITETQYRRAQQLIANSYKEDKRIESVIFYFDENNEQARDFNIALFEHPELKFTNQIIAASTNQQEAFPASGYCLGDQVFHIDKPIGLFELELTFRKVYGTREGEELDVQGDTESPSEKDKVKILVCGRHADTEEYVHARLGSLNCDLLQGQSDDEIKAHFKNIEDFPKAVLIDCDEEPNFIRIVELIRKIEIQGGLESFIPILGMSTAHDAKEVAAYELGIDDFLELSNHKHDLKSALEYWLSLE